MTLDGTGRAVGPCPIGTCNPVDICAVCRLIVTVDGRRAWHTGICPAWCSRSRAHSHGPAGSREWWNGADHEAAPIVVCAWCGAEAEAVSPSELAEAWGAMLAARPVEGQTSWVE